MKSPVPSPFRCSGEDWLRQLQRRSDHTLKRGALGRQEPLSEVDQERKVYRCALPCRQTIY